MGESALLNNMSATNGKVIRGRKTNEMWDIPESAAVVAVDTILQRVIPGERQSAERGVHAIKGPLQRLKVRLPADASNRPRLLRICCHIFNLRT